MKRLLVLLAILPVVAIAGMGHKDHHEARPSMLVDADSARTVEYEFGLTGKAENYNDLFIRLIVADDATGEIANNEDSVRVYLFTEILGTRIYLDSAKSAELPDTVTFRKPAFDADGGVLNDTIWGPLLGIRINIDSDTTEDTSFTSYFPVKAEWVLR